MVEFLLVSQPPPANSPWRRSGFRWFFLGQSISLLGGALTPVALSFAVLDASGSGRDLGLILAANTVPLLALLLVGGAVADRFSRGTVLVASHVGAGLTQCAVAALLLSGRYHLGGIIALEVVNGAFAAFTLPALRGIVPQLVDKAALQRANSAQATARNVTRVAGPTIAGILVVGVGGGWAIAVDGASFLIAAVCLARLRLPAGMPHTARRSILADVRSGWGEFRALPWVPVVVGCFAVTNVILVAVWVVLGPVLAQRTIGPAAWGVVISARAVGLLVMSVVMYRLTATHLLRLGQLCAALIAVPFVVLGLGAPAGWLAAAAFIAGMGAAVTGRRRLRRAPGGRGRRRDLRADHAGRAGLAGRASPPPHHLIHVVVAAPVPGQLSTVEDLRSVPVGTSAAARALPPSPIVRVVRPARESSAGIRVVAG
jgi:MFS family permease